MYGHVFTYILNWTSVVMNPAIYVGTQEKYRIALRLLFSGNKERIRRNSLRTSRSDNGDHPHPAKFYVRQISSNTDSQNEFSHAERHSSRKIQRKVSFSMK